MTSPARSPNSPTASEMAETALTAMPTPSWLQPFHAHPNVRFTRTPDNLRARTNQSAAPSASEPDPVPSPYPVISVARSRKTSNGPARVEPSQPEPHEINDEAHIYNQALAIVFHDRKASTAHIQRRMQISYNSALSVMRRMERAGIVGPVDRAGRREIYADGPSDPSAF
jgi:DNA segregation ATPase FtsK/SpoIIIE-like protein